VNPHLLGVQIKFSGHTDLSYLSPYFAPSKKLEGGKLYTVDELLTRMIVYSDNDALFLLVDHLGEPLVSQTFKEVGLPDPFADGHKEQEYALTVEQYVLSLRLLYNASYLSKAMSEKALGLLTEIEFRQGLVEGVPPDIPVAHKFGERVSDDSFHNKELHDCGVIYYPAHPYLLCVMTKGDSFQYLDDGIKEISQTVYEEVDRSWNIVGKKSFPENLNH